MKVDGRCHCGAIVYAAEVDPEMADVCHCLDCQCFSGAPYRASVPAKAADFPPVERQPPHLHENGRQRRETGAGLLWRVRHGPLRLRGRKPGGLPPPSRRDPPAGGNPAAPTNLACLSACLGVRHRRTALVAGRLMATVHIRLGRWLTGRRQQPLQMLLSAPCIPSLIRATDPRNPLDSAALPLHIASWFAT